MSGLIRDSDIVIDVSMSVYGLESVNFSSPINSIAAYAANSGCKTYCGVLAEDKEGMEALVIYRNEAAAYNHIFRIKFPHSVIALGKGNVRARLTPFVPTHSIKYLFEEIML